MRIRSITLALCLITGAAWAQEPPAWQKAGSVAVATDADVRAHGIAGIAPHVDDLEASLKGGAAFFPSTQGADGKTIVLTDGPPEALLALAMAAKAQRATQAVADPYAEIGLLLTLYYNEMHRPEDALRVSQAALALKPVPNTFVGLHDASLFTEQADAYATLKRFDDALVASDAALKASSNNRDKARSERARGFDLTELKRLDDAEAAYNQSLVYEPGNALAQRELTYIARLRAGGAEAPVQQTTTGEGAGQPKP